MIAQDLAHNAVDQAVAYLSSKENSRRQHSGVRLIDHLMAVESKLRMWRCRQDICLAGLLHSIYGTEHFRHQTVPLSEREQVRALVGEAAEQLAYQFSLLDTRAFLAQVEADLSGPGQQLTDGGGYSPDEKLDLLHLFAANWLEQMPRMRPLHRGRYVNLFREIKPLLVPLAGEELEQTYGFEKRRVRPPVFVGKVGADVAGEPGGQIRVLDDFAPEHLMLRLTALTENNIWRYGWKSAKTQTNHGFWHSHFAGDNEDRDACCEYELTDRRLMEPVLELWHLIRDTIAPGHIPVRVYANGHTYGGDGHLHTDSDLPGHYTSIYYAHPTWDVNWAGETVFFDQDGTDVIKSVFPKPGRLVHFPGQIPHAARTPSRECPALRAVFVIKTFLPNVPPAGPGAT